MEQRQKWTVARAGFMAAGVFLIASTALGAEPVAASPPGFLERFWRFLGILHPMIVHFPIALLTLAAAMEILRLKFKGVSPDVAYYSLLFAAAGGVVATMFGWSRAENLAESDNLFYHRWMGSGVMLLSLALAVLATVARRRPQAEKLRQLQTVGVCFAAGLVGLVGHLGGELTYGEGFVQEAFKQVIHPEAGRESPAPVSVKNPAKPSPSTKTLVAALKKEPHEGLVKSTPELAIGEGEPSPTVSSQVDFTTQIWPILEVKCVICHSSRKKKGGLRLDTEAYALKGGSSGQPAYVQGDSNGSLILKLIASDDDEEKMPPPGEGKVVTRKEHDLLTAWVEQGAKWTPPLPAPPK